MQNPPPPPPPPGSQPPQYIAPPAQLAPQGAGYAAPGSTSYGGFWIRLVARIIDGFVLSVPLGILFAIIAAIGGGIAATTTNSTDQNAQAAVGLGLVAVIVLIAGLATVGTIIYYIYFWGTSGSTLGMRLFKLRIVDAHTGGPIGIGRAAIRYLMTIVNTMACYIGWIWVAFDARKQGWHDKVADSVVIQG